MAPVTDPHGSRTIWSLLGREPPAGSVLPSAGPGTGPYAADTRVNSVPQAGHDRSGYSGGGPVIPPTGTPNALGYGGGGDTVTIAKPASEGVTHFDVSGAVHSANRRMPGLAVHGPPAPLVPRYNILYDSLRSRDGWRNIAEISADGSITPNTAAIVTSAITPTAGQQLTLRLSRFPGGIQAHLVLNAFSISPTATTATGALVWYWLDPAGNLNPIGTSQATSNYNLTSPIVSRTPITDTGESFSTPNLGSVYVKMVNGGTPVAVAYQVGFSVVYVLPEPAMRGYMSDGPAVSIAAPVYDNHPDPYGRGGSDRGLLP